MLNEIVWTRGQQESILLKVDPQEEYAYVFADSFVLSYNLLTKKVVELFNNTFFDQDEETFIPKAVDLTNNWAVVTGYSSYRQFDCDVWKIYPVQLRPKMLSVCPVSNASGFIENTNRMGKSCQTYKYRHIVISVSMFFISHFLSFFSYLFFFLLCFLHSFLSFQFFTFL